MPPDRQQDVVVGIANAVPGVTITAAAKVSEEGPPDYVLWATLFLITIQVGYYLWKWRSDYLIRKQQAARERRDYLASLAREQVEAERRTAAAASSQRATEEV